MNLIYLPVLITLFLGCSLPGFSRVDLLLPPLPAAWKGEGSLPVFTIRYPMEGEPDVFFEVPYTSSPIPVTLPKINNLPVLAVPSFAGRSEPMLPAGAIFPLHMDGKTLPLRFGEGFAAEIFFDLQPLGRGTEYFNAKRLSTEIKKVSGDNPWALDRDRIIEGIRFGFFRVDMIKVRDPLFLQASFPPGTYLRANPFFPPYFSDTANPKFVGPLYPGKNFFFQSRGKGEIRIVIKEKQWFIIYPEYVLSGSL